MMYRRQLELQRKHLKPRIVVRQINAEDMMSRHLLPEAEIPEPIDGFENDHLHAINLSLARPKSNHNRQSTCITH
jgi:hypothetical protein